MMKVYKIKYLAFFASLLLMSFVSIAQDTQISGKVKDAQSGEALPGVTIYCNGTGAVTDIDGNYTVNAGGDDEVTFSFIGYLTQIVSVNGRSSINISLEEDLVALEEVVITGYGVQKKKVVTGAISQISAAKLEKTADMRIEQALQGRAAGVMVMNNSGQPGDQLSVIIRGAGSNGDVQPLYIVDGLPLSGAGLDFLNPADVESIEILKDATSSAIYGTRASNGVVLITTKGGGRSEKTSFSYSGYYGVQNPWKQQDVLNADQYMNTMNQASINDGSDLMFPLAARDTINGDTDWQDEMFNYNAPKTSHTVSMIGGSENGSFASSINYFSQEGLVAPGKSEFERITFRIKGERSFKRLTVGGNVNFVNITTKGIDTNSQYGAGINQAINMPPIVPVKNADGSWGVPGDYNLAMQEVVNPVALLHYNHSETNTYKGLGGLTAELELIDGLKIRSAFSTEVAFVDNRSYTPLYYINPTNKTDFNSASKSVNEYFRWNWDNTITYKKQLGDHNVTALVGFSRFREWSEGVWGSKDSLIFDTFDKAYIDNSSQILGQTSGGFSEATLQSYFARVYYDYREKYLLEAVVRVDGSSRFGSENRYGTFPGAAIGWVFTEENFFPSLGFMDFGKLRVSWGRNGNQNIGNFQYTSIISTGNSYFFGTGQRLYDGIQPSFISNPSIKWESSEQLDIGLDLRFFNGKLTVAADYYDKRNTDWLVSGNGFYPRAGVGNNVGVINAGDIRNSGFELELGYKNTFGEGLFADISFTASTNKNELLDIADGLSVLNGAGGAHGQGTIQRAIIGEPMGYFWGYQTDGLFTNAAELGTTDHQPNAQLGDLKFVDTNDDGILDDEDKVKLGNPYPKLMMGLNLAFDWKGIDFGMFWYSAVGHQIYNASRRSDLMVSNYTTDALDAWSEDNTSGSLPRLTLRDDNRSWRNPSDFYVEDADYLRLKNIQIGYTLPKGMLEAIKVEKVRIYFLSENLLTFTKYSGMEAEIGGGPLNMGVDYGIYPQPKTFIGGINITF
ncbi:MAG: TonB-dependent receptor [Reichenbachiella sp.]